MDNRIHFASAPVSLSRRRFVQGLAAAAATGLTIQFRLAEGQPVPDLPAMIKRNPNLNAWVRIAPDGAVTVFTGRVEIGQGCLTAMLQIAAEELDVAPGRITLVSGDTAQTPDEGVTSGSFSMKLGGTALGHACADARGTLVRAAAEAWKVDASTLKVEDGSIIGPSGARMHYGEAASRVSLTRPVDPAARRKPASSQRIIGSSYPRVDIPAKVFGQPVFIHDLRPEGMLFGAIARPPAYAARVVSVDLAPIKAMPGVVEVVRDGSFLGVIARREEQARAAAEKLAAAARWDVGPALFAGKGVFEHLLNAPAEVKVIHETRGGALDVVSIRHKAEYRRAFQAHASIGASCALAQCADGKLTVWSHTQGPFSLRAHLAKALRTPEVSIRVIHAQGAGCYGHNGADDVALDAALLARAVAGRPVRVQWSHEEEMAWEPWGSAMIVRLEAGVAGDGRLTAWNHDVWSFPHSTRPGPSGGMEGCNLRSAWYLAEPLKASKPRDGALPNGAAGRNAVPIYAAASQRVTTHFLAEMPIRTSALRTLGGFFNAVSAEMFLDELAAMSGHDPVSFRLKNVRDERLVAVLSKAVEMSGWTPTPVSAGRKLAREMLGMGVGLSRYKNQDSYVAVVAEVSVDTASGAVRVLRMWSATDTGRSINPDGVINQIEGGMVQAASWTLLESGRFDVGIMKAVDYADYPIIDFTGSPKIQSALIDRPEMPPLGAGEGSQAPAGAAIANAIFAATGRRITEIPFTRERVLAALQA
ncbi:MAG: xanthine dehydrogenase family protein molybdopterin-binding subunit [Betaproteobacteria bacterium]|nr:xanthine dehydrogenase family protein molybdopterin-binding subunit [Betaproteobacteria bacterium]